MKVARDGRFVSDTAEIMEAALKSMVAHMPILKRSTASYEARFRITRLRESCGVPQTITVHIRKPLNYIEPVEE